MSDKNFSYRSRNNPIEAEPHQCDCGCGGLCRRTGKPCSHGEQKGGQAEAALKFKKVCMGLLLAAGMLFAAGSPAGAIDFKAQGEWLVGFGVGDGNLVSKTGPRGGQKNRADTNDTFNAGQRVRLQLDAVASEALSGTVFFEIGDQIWGKNADNNGAALGADGVVVEVKNAYLDWVVPQTDLKFRMGLQAVALPNAAGGSAILDADGAAVTASYKFNDNVGLTAMWVRPVNDNFGGWRYTNGDTRTHDANYLDNIDLFMLSLPLTFDGVEVTPWVMYGIMGKNALDGYDDGNFRRYDRQGNGARTSVGNGWTTADGSLHNTLINYHPGFATNDLAGGFGRSHAYGSMFWAGLPVTLSLWDPLNIEFDVNYGYVEGMGRYDVQRRNDPADSKRASTKRQGWLVKALVEYKLDWGVPGIFGWYASGDDGNVKNGSERMPSVAGAGNFTSFVGDGNLAWGTITKGNSYDWNMSYAGTWGVGLQLRDMSFIDDLEHTFRVALWGGTNSPSMVKYFADSNGWNNGYGADGPYLTTHDNLLEFNLVNSYKMYENLELNLELGYVVNMVNKDTWDRRWMNDSYQKQDAWKAQLIFAYTF